MIEINVAVSNRHVHLCKEDADFLFGVGYNFKKRNDLSQKGEFATLDTVDLKTATGIIKQVRVVGPIRSYTQVELSKSDSDILGLDLPIRDSGDLKDAKDITIIGPKGEKEIKKWCITSVNHIHANSGELKEFSNNSIVNVITKKGIVIKNVHIKKADNFVLEMHIDKDNSQKYNLVTGDTVFLEKR